MRFHEKYFIFWTITKILKEFPAVIISPSLSDHYKKILEANIKRNCRILAIKWKFEQYPHEWPRIIEEDMESIWKKLKDFEKKMKIKTWFTRAFEVDVRLSLKKVYSKGTYIKGGGKISNK